MSGAGITYARMMIVATRRARLRARLEQGEEVRSAAVAWAATHACWLIRAGEHPRADVNRVAQWLEAEAQATEARRLAAP